MKRMLFHKYGKARHLKIESAEDFENILNLDEALWVATGASTDTLRCDKVFLDFLDADNNERIMCYEVHTALEWLQEVLNDKTGINEASSVIKLASINADSKDGKSILTASKKILRRLGKADAEEITLEQIRKIKAKEEKLPVSEAGVVLPDATDDEEVRQCIKELIEVTGGTPHPSGNPGLDEEDIDRFRKSASERIAWHAKAALEKDDDKTEIMPLGVDTPAAYKIYSSLREKLDHYFAQCEAVTFDKRTAEHFLPSQAKLQSTNLAETKSVREIMSVSPLAPPSSDLVLKLEDNLNPLYADQLKAFFSDVVAPLAGKGPTVLSKKEWISIQKTFKPHEEWLAVEPGKELAKLGMEKIEKYMGDGVDKAMRELTEESSKTAFVLDNIRLAEKLALYQVNMISFLNNFVSFPDLYNPDQRALFEMGTMIVDGRHLNFSTRVTDRKTHSKVAGTSDIFVVYADITPEDKKQPKFTVALPVTSGTKGNLQVGKRGVFRDLSGKIMDAQIVQIIENPISLWETLISPFTRIGSLITKRIESMSQAAEKKLDKATTSVFADTKAKKDGDQQGVNPGNLLMGGGVAIAALGSSFAFIAKTLSNLGIAKSLLGIGAAILAFMLPASLIALIKLTNRDISSILEGAGWSINARMRLDRTQGRVFTRVPRLPKNSKVLPKSKKVLWVILVAAIIITLLAVFNNKGVSECDPTEKNSGSTQKVEEK